MKMFSKKYFEVLFNIGVVLGFAILIDRNLISFLPDFISGMFTSISIVFIILAGSLKNSEKFIERMEIENNDERIQMIKGKAFETTHYMTTVISIAIIILFGFMGDIYKYIALGIAVFLLIQKIILLISKAKLSQKY